MTNTENLSALALHHLVEACRALAKLNLQHTGATRARVRVSLQRADEVREDLTELVEVLRGMR